MKTEAVKKPVEYVNNAFIKVEIESTISNTSWLMKLLSEDSPHLQDYTPEAELLQLLDSISEKFPDITKR